MVKTMIMSLGGSPEPLIHSIRFHQPETILFLASHDSVIKSGDIQTQLGYKPIIKFEITEDPDNLRQCYEAARACLARLEPIETDLGEVMVDYTGGTKPMVAALVLATVGKKFKFNYVGGKDRDKNGLGAVVSGSETMISDMSPWAVFAEEERRQIVLLFNQGRFASVIEIIRAIRKESELPPPISRFFRMASILAQGYLQWEQFDHQKAREKIKEGRSDLRDYMAYAHNHKCHDLATMVESNFSYLCRLIEKTHAGERLHVVLVRDLLGNARRRIRGGGFEDASARIYRALEMYGQVNFQEVAGCRNSEVAPDKIPPVLRDEYTRKYMDDEKGVLKLPLMATFRFLAASRDEAGIGIRFLEHEEKILNVLSNRNESILAHGIKQVTEKAVQSAFRVVCEFTGMDEFEEFPTLPVT